MFVGVWFGVGWNVVDEVLKELCFYRMSGVSLSCSFIIIRNCYDYCFLVCVDCDFFVLCLYFYC